MVVAVESTASVGYPSIYALDGVSSTTAENGGWWLVQNCTWNTGSNLWNQTNASKASSALFVGSAGFTFYRKAASSAAWGLTSWDSSFKIGEVATAELGATSEMYASSVAGNAFERIHFSYAANSPITGTQAFVFPIPINFRSRHPTMPAPVITVLTETDIAALPVYVTTGTPAVDAWGGYLRVTTDINAWTAGDTYSITGYVDIY
jgi:hypothetical protein